MLARISSSALRPRGEVRVPVSHRGDPASIVLRLWKAVCPQNPRSTSAVSQQHIVLEPGDLRRDSRAPPTTCGGTDAPGSATCSVHGRVARRWVPAFETAPSDNLSPLDRPLATEMRMRLQSGPRGPSPCGRVPFGRGAGSGAFSRSANVATVPAPAHSQCLAVAAGSRGCGNGPSVARDRLQATTVPRGEQ